MNTLIRHKTYLAQDMFKSNIETLDIKNSVNGKI